MKNLLGFLKTTLIGGLVVITPIVLTVLILIEAVDLVLEVLTPVVDLLPNKTIGSMALATLVAFGLVIGLCFLAGLMLRSERGAALTEWIEQKLLSLIPGYNLFRNVVRRIANVQDTADLMPAVISTVPGTQVLAFVIEEHEDGDCTVFVPSSPALTIGTVQYVAKEKIRKLDAPIQQVANCIMEWGAGSKPLFRPA